MRNVSENENLYKQYKVVVTSFYTGPTGVCCSSELWEYGRIFVTRL